MARLHNLRMAQSALASLASPGTVNDEQERELNQFLAQLPRLWEQGEVRPTHRQTPARARDYRTREDPFESVWSELVLAGKGTGRHGAITVCNIAGGTSRGIHRRSGPHASTASASVAAHYGEAIDSQYTGHLKLGRLLHARSAYWSPNMQVCSLLLRGCLRSAFSV